MTISKKPGTLEIHVSGVHSGPDPSPGIGIAKSIRQAFPDAKILAIDYSRRSSGLNHQVFDGARVYPAWEQLDLSLLSEDVTREILRGEVKRISGLDAEIDWLSSLDLPSRDLLIPSAKALKGVIKPEISVAADLGMRVPEWLPATAPPTELAALVRRCSSSGWVKGRYHEAYRVNGYQNVNARIAQMNNNWPLDQIFVQNHIHGVEQAYTFAAFEGRLLGAVKIEKRLQTETGKTWSAEVSRANEAFCFRLREVVRRLKWTGGGEVEYVLDENGKEWLIDLNPRFPAYIHGVTLCGMNLPGMLVSAALGRKIPSQKRPSGQFIRVVEEIRVSSNLTLDAPRKDSQQFSAIQSKHPSHQPALVRLMNPRTKGPPFATREDRDLSSRLLLRPPDDVADRRRRVTDASRVCSALDRLVAVCSPIRLQPALSVKTDPWPALAQEFLDRDWLVECISPKELEWALQHGWNASNVVLNGPIAPQSVIVHGASSLGFAFADSTASLRMIVRSNRVRLPGVRICPASFASRFGIELSDFSEFKEVLQIYREADESFPIALHMHLPVDVLGVGAWCDAIDEVIGFGIALQNCLKRPLTCIDIGGGWHPDDISAPFEALIADTVRRCAVIFPKLERVMIELGKAVSAPSARYHATILEVRPARRTRPLEVIVDASIADLPMCQYYAQEIHHVRGENYLGILNGGENRVLGAICMESDVLADRIGFSVHPLPGDQLVFIQAGGYNSSMAWHFAKGRSRDES